MSPEFESFAFVVELAIAAGVLLYCLFRPEQRRRTLQYACLLLPLIGIIHSSDPVRTTLFYVAGAAVVGVIASIVYVGRRDNLRLEEQKRGHS